MREQTAPRHKRVIGKGYATSIKFAKIARTTMTNPAKVSQPRILIIVDPENWTTS
jgi:hypothetical protein